MSSILLYHPIGLGDHIACNGLVREYCKRYDRVGLFCYPQNEPSVSFMYRDLPNLRLHVVRSHKEAGWFLFKNKFMFGKNRYSSLLNVGSFDPESGIKYERQFYNSAHLPLAVMWDSFFVKRDAGREKELAKRMHAEGSYAFVHDDKRFPIDRSTLPKSLCLLGPDLSLTENIFDYCSVLEHAKEIHVVDSSFMFLVDCLPYKNTTQKLFVHRYARPNMAWNLPILKKQWTILA